MVQIRVSPDKIFSVLLFLAKNVVGSGGIRTHAPEETGALNQRLRPLGHATFHMQCSTAQKAIQSQCSWTAGHCPAHRLYSEFCTHKTEPVQAKLFSTEAVAGNFKTNKKVAVRSGI